MGNDDKLPADETKNPTKRSSRRGIGGLPAGYRVAGIWLDRGLQHDLSTSNVERVGLRGNSRRDW